MAESGQPDVFLQFPSWSYQIQKYAAPFGFASMVKVAFRPQTIQEYNSLMAKCVPFSTVGTLIYIIWVPELLTGVLCMIESDLYL